MVPSLIGSNVYKYMYSSSISFGWQIFFSWVCRTFDVLRSGVSDLVVAGSFPQDSAGVIVCCIIRVRI